MRGVHPYRHCACADRIGDETAYGPGFVAHLITAKCGDSLPIYRLEKQCAREGVPSRGAR
ncbi:Hypothetical protein A7982_03307 [Minicystis rosea]|nr:Hypothetical protein A7982_03307 [Minicystis rosea]